MFSFRCVCFVVIGFLYVGAEKCDPQQYETCTNRFIERDFTFFEEIIKSYPNRMRPIHLDGTDIAQFCSGFQELVECYVRQYANCDAPDIEKEKIIRAAVSVLKLLCDPKDRTLIQRALQNARCYLEADAQCRSYNVTMFTWKEILRFERLLDRQATCNALIDHGACLLTKYNSAKCGGKRMEKEEHRTRTEAVATTSQEQKNTRSSIGEFARSTLQSRSLTGRFSSDAKAAKISARLCAYHSRLEPSSLESKQRQVQRNLIESHKPALGA